MPAGQIPTLEVQAQPVPDSALEAIGSARELAAKTHGMVSQLCSWIAAASKPARPIPIALSQATPSVTDNARERSQSIGLYNPTDVVLYIGLDGGPASSRARSISCPPGGLLILPISVEDVTVATEDDLAGGDVVATLLRFSSVQPAFLGTAAV